MRAPNCRTTRLNLPNKAWHAKYQKELLARKKTYLFTVPELMMFKDPASGESVFSQIGMNAFLQLEVKKAMDSAIENNVQGLDECFGQILERSYVDPSRERI
jgi:hypothetical protein